MVTKAEFIAQMRKTQAPLPGMVAMVPDDRLDWTPADGFMSCGQLLKHLSENWCIIKMMIANDWPWSSPAEMLEAMTLEKMPSLGTADALAAMEKDLAGAVAYLEQEIGEEEFFTREVTAPWGFTGAIWQAVLMAKEHQVNHKMQLHLYLKLLGKPVNTQTLYGM